MLSVQFGSLRRGDYIASSDKDLLLLADDWHQLESEKAKRKEQGYSVTCFTSSKIDYLSKTGSLFFKHIIEEGLLVSGRTGEYSRLIKNWSPARSYDNQIESNLDLLEVLFFVPHSRIGIAIAVDIIITSLRNILIRRLAQEGEYIFSWRGVLQAARKRNQITLGGLRICLRARRIKNQYRTGSLPAVDEHFLEQLAAVASRIFSRRKLYQFGQHKDIVALPDRCDDRTYKQLRALELMCGAYNFDSSLRDFLIWIKDPNYFSSHC